MVRDIYIFWLSFTTKYSSVCSYQDLPLLKLTINSNWMHTRFLCYGQRDYWGDVLLLSPPPNCIRTLYNILALISKCDQSIHVLINWRPVVSGKFVDSMSTNSLLDINTHFPMNNIRYLYYACASTNTYVFPVMMNWTLHLLNIFFSRLKNSSNFIRFLLSDSGGSYMYRQREKIYQNLAKT